MNRRNNNKRRINNKIKKNKRRIRGVKRRMNQNMRRINKKMRSVQRRIPAAYTGTRNGRFFRIVYSDNTSITVMGRDLVYKTPKITLKDNYTNVISVIPANPAYWSGTRVSNIALGYQQYRPLKFEVHYEPTVSTTRSGSLFAGTLWNTVPTEDNLEQTLTGSQGSMNSQLFKPVTSRVRLGRNLNTNLYNIHGPLDTDSNPFIFVAIVKGEFPEDQRSNPGLFYVNYTFTFKNPMGSGTTFNTPGLILYKELEYKPNTTAYLCKSIIYYISGKGYKLPVFSPLDVDWSELGAPVASYNGEPVQLEEDTPIWVFQNWSNENPIQQPLRTLLTFSNLISKEGDSTPFVGNIPPNSVGVFFAESNFLDWDVPEPTLGYIINLGSQQFPLSQNQIHPINNHYYIGVATIESQEYKQLEETKNFVKQWINTTTKVVFTLFPNTQDNRYRINDHDIFVPEEVRAKPYNPLVYWEKNGNHYCPRYIEEDD